MAVAMARAAGSATSITRLRVRVPLPVLFVVLSFLCPTEFSVYVFGLRLPPHRIALILLLPIALKRMLSQRDMRLKAFDLLVFFYSAWSMTSYSVHGQSTEGIVYGGSVALESFGSYAVARAFIRDAETFMATLKFLVLSVAVAGLIALPETLFGGYFTHDFLRSMIGGEKMPPVEQRLGLYRAASVFDHPIHLGTFCASLLALIWFAEKRAPIRNTCLVIVTLATLTALSSAPMLCLALQLGLIALERATRGLEGRLMLLFIIFAGLYIGASLVGTRSPMAIIATGFTLDSWTGYYRLMIWEYGIDTVTAHPLLGIGQADWVRPKWMVSTTIDAFWLVIAMRTGIPSVVFLGLAIILMAGSAIAWRRRSRDPALRNICTGWVISLTALSLAAATVHLWNVVFAYYFFFLGLAGWIADPVKTRKPIVKPTMVVKRRRYVPQPPAGYPARVAPGGTMIAAE
jgi:hypothetical protein